MMIRMLNRHIPLKIPFSNSLMAEGIASDVLYIVKRV
jgi:hypothetical protein